MNSSGHVATAALRLAEVIGARAPVLRLHAGLDGGDVAAAANPRRLAAVRALRSGAHRPFSFCDFPFLTWTQKLYIFLAL